MPGVFHERRIDEADDAPPATPGQRPAMVVTSTMAGNEEDERDARLGDRENRPVQRRRRDGDDRGKREAPQRGFLDPRPQPGQAEIPGDP